MRNLFVFVSLYVCAYVLVRVCVFVFMCMCMCMFSSVYMCICMYVRIRAHVYMHRCSCSPKCLTRILDSHAFRDGYIQYKTDALTCFEKSYLLECLTIRFDGVDLSCLGLSSEYGQQGKASCAYVQHSPAQCGTKDSDPS